MIGLWSCKDSLRPRYWSDYIKLSFWTRSSPHVWKCPSWWLPLKFGKITFDWASWWNPVVWFCLSWRDFSKFPNFSSILEFFGLCSTWFFPSCTEDCLRRLVDCLKDGFHLEFDENYYWLLIYWLLGTSTYCIPLTCLLSICLHFSHFLFLCPCPESVVYRLENITSSHVGKVFMWRRVTMYTQSQMKNEWEWESFKSTGKIKECLGKIEKDRRKEYKIR